MKIGRRSILPLLGGAPLLLAQGIATRHVKPAPAGKPSGLPFLAQFTDIAASAGLTAPTVYGGIDRKDYIPETMGCGCAFFDYDNDGWLDIVLLSGTRFNADPPGATNRLYRNNRDGTFTDVTARAGLTHTGWACGVTVGDFDNDGFEDVFISCWGENLLYRNNGDGTFTEMAKQAGVHRNRTQWGTGCAWIDYDRDGRLDLLVTSYSNFNLSRALKPGADEHCMFGGLPVNCGPRGLPGGALTLYRNNGNGTFTDVTEAAGLSKIIRYGLTAVTADFDEDGWPDIFIACDAGASLLLINNRDGTFREEGLERGAALSFDGLEQAGMGVGIGDYNTDGHLDFFKGHFSDDTNGLYRNDGRGNFTDVTLPSGLGVETRYTGWGAGIVDFDNNGDPDLFLVTGSIYPEIEKKLPAYPLRTPRLVFRNLGNGAFEELIAAAGPGIAAPHCSRGCAFGDFDNDGDLDVLIVNLNEPPSLLRNDVRGQNRWVKIRLVGTKSNRSAIGARVTVRYGARRQTQCVTGQASYLSCNDPRLHFGTGTEKTIDIDVAWPSGAKEAFTNLNTNQLLVIREGAGAVERALWPGR